jgi:hypothetical protein
MTLINWFGALMLLMIPLVPIFVIMWKDMGLKEAILGFLSIVLAVIWIMIAANLLCIKETFSERQSTTTLSSSL